MSGQNNGTQIDNRQAGFREHVESIVVQKCAEFMSGAAAQQRLIRAVLAEAAKNARILDCTPASVAHALMTCAQLQLEPSSIMGFAYLVPRKNNQNGGKIEATLQIGYKGYAELARRTGLVQTMDARVVYRADEFRVVYGMRRDLHHVPNLEVDRRDEDIIGAYAVLETKDGGVYFEFIDRQEILKRAGLAMSDKFWRAHFERMARKSAVRALFAGGLAPISSELVKAIEEDVVIEGDVSVFDERPKGKLSAVAIAQTPDYDEPEIVDEPQPATRAPQRARSTDRQPTLTNTSNDGMPE